MSHTSKITMLSPAENFGSRLQRMKHSSTASACLVHSLGVGKSFQRQAKELYATLDGDTHRARSSCISNLQPSSRFSEVCMERLPDCFLCRIMKLAGHEIRRIRINAHRRKHPFDSHRLAARRLMLTCRRLLTSSETNLCGFIQSVETGSRNQTLWTSTACNICSINSLTSPWRLQCACVQLTTYRQSCLCALTEPAGC